MYEKIYIWVHTYTHILFWVLFDESIDFIMILFYSMILFSDKKLKI